MPIRAFRPSTKNVSTLGKEFDPVKVGVIKEYEDHHAIALTWETPQSTYQVLIQPDAFEELAKKMIAANKATALKAFGLAIIEAA